MKKSELIDELMELAQIPDCWHALEQRLDLQPETKDDLINRTQKAISDATAFDYREMNSNFDYDSAAYERIKRYFKQLIKEGHIDAAMQLAEHLMAEGTKQVEMSDECLMWSEIEESLDVVFDGVEKSGLAADQIAAWAARLQKADCVGLYDRAEEFQKKQQKLPTQVAGSAKKARK